MPPLTIIRNLLELHREAHGLPSRRASFAYFAASSFVLFRHLRVFVFQTPGVARNLAPHPWALAALVTAGPLNYNSATRSSVARRQHQLPASSPAGIAAASALSRVHSRKLHGTNGLSSSWARACSQGAASASTGRAWWRLRGSARSFTAQGCDVIVVTSGAIAAGREQLGHPRLPPDHRREADARRGRAEPADARLGGAVRDLWPGRRADAADARRRRGPRPLPERPRRAAGAARTPHRAGHQRERRGRDRRNQGRRQRQPVGHGGGAGRGRSVCCCSPTSTACTRPTRAPTPTRS